MNVNPSSKSESNNEDCLLNANECFLSHDSHRHPEPSKARNSSEYHSSSKDLNAQMCGATPVPQRLRGRPPRSSLQSISSRTTVSAIMDSHSPFFADLSKPAHNNTHINCSMNSSDFVLT